MEKSYFFLFSTRLKYPLYVCLMGSVSVTDMLDFEHVWNVIYHVTCLSIKDYSVEQCTPEMFYSGLVKIDFSI